MGIRPIMSIIRIFFHTLHGGHKQLSYLLRQIYYLIYVNSKPSHQTILGIVFIPLGVVISYFALYGDPSSYYPYFVVFGVAFSIMGILLTAKGVRGLKQGRPKVAEQQNTGQYAPNPSQAYGQAPRDQN
jgi:hypothetical protein